MCERRVGLSVEGIVRPLGSYPEAVNEEENNRRLMNIFHNQKV